MSCEKCGGKGYIDTGNNDIPCECQDPRYKRNVHEERVLKAARQYGRMRAFGVVVEGKHTVIPSGADQDEDSYADELCERALDLVKFLACSNEKGEIEE